MMHNKLRSHIGGSGTIFQTSILSESIEMIIHVSSRASFSFYINSWMVNKPWLVRHIFFEMSTDREQTLQQGKYVYQHIVQ